MNTLSQLYKEHMGAIAKNYSGPYGLYMKNYLVSVSCIYYRLNNDISAEEIIEKGLNAIDTLEVPPWYDPELDGMNEMDCMSESLKIMVDVVWKTDNPEKQGLQVIETPVEDEWYIAVVEIPSILAEREYTDPVGNIVKFDYSDEENPTIPLTLNLAGFYRKDVGFTFFDERIGSLNIEDVNQYRLLRNWN